MAKQFAVKLLLAQSVTAATTGAAQDLQGSASALKREMKVVVASNTGTYSTATLASWPVVLEECDTTNGTYTAIQGDTVTTIAGTSSTVATASEYHVTPAHRYVRARVTTPGTGGTSINLTVLMIDEKRVS